MVVPVESPGEEGSAVGAMREDGWLGQKHSWPVGKHWERQAGGKQMSVFNKMLGHFGSKKALLSAHFQEGLVIFFLI